MKEPRPELAEVDLRRASQRPIGFRLALGLCAVVALGTRWLFLGAESVWFDEGWTWWLVSHPASQMLRLMQADTVAPAFFYLLHFWIRLFGDSAVALRSLSALLATLVLWPWALLARRMLVSRRAFLVAAALMSFSFMQAQYAREARPYALLMLLSLGAFACVPTLADRRSWRAMFGFAACIVGGMYTHNAMPFYAASLAAAWLIWPGRRPTRARCVDLAIVVALSLAAYVPWVPSLREQARWMDGNFWVSRPDAVQACLTTTTVCGVEVYDVTPALWRAFNHAPTAEAIAIFVTVGVGVSVMLGICTRDPARRRQAIALMTVAFGPMIAVFLYSRIAQPIFLRRLFMTTSALVPIALALPLDIGRGRGVKFVGGVIVAAMGVLGLVSTVALLVTPQKEDWRGAYTYVAHLPPSPGRLIVFFAAEGQLPFDFYAAHDRSPPADPKTGIPGGFYGLDPPRTIRRVRSPADLETLHKTLASGGVDEVVLVLSHHDFVDPDGIALAWLEAHLRVEEERKFRNVTVRRLRPR